nr:hypothetical protein [Actinomycetota bacterium]
MNEMNRDTQVARALDRLPVPEHGADFWRDLDARLDAEDGLDESLGRRVAARRGRKSPRTLLAVAAALALVVGAAALTTLDRDDRDTVTAGDTGNTTQPTTTPSPSDTT